MGQNFSSEPVVEKETERDHNETFNVAVSSCQGWRISQEDNHSLMLDLPGGHKAAFFAVFDGHGSARVSKHASEALWKHLTQNELYTQGNFKEALEKAFLTFDREVNDSYNAQLAGTTAICVLIVDNVIYCANIGDSRAVASVNCQCIPLSHDHKPENPQELKRILAAGGYVLGNRVNGNLALSRAFGDFHYKGNDQLPPEQQIVSPCPDIKRIELNDEVDFIVLACDGIWDVLTSEEVVEFVISRLEQNIEPGLICEQLTTRCLATDYELVIGCDNMTVLLVCHTRGKGWEDYCTEIFEKNSKRLGSDRKRVFQDLETLNQDVQQSRLRVDPASNRMNEMLDLASTSPETSSSAPTPSPNDQEAPTESDDAPKENKSDKQSRCSAKELDNIELNSLWDITQHFWNKHYQGKGQLAVDFPRTIQGRESMKAESDETDALSSSKSLRSQEDETDTTSPTEIQQNDDDQKTSTDDQRDRSTEKDDTTTATNTTSSSPSVSQAADDDDCKSSQIHEIHLSSPDDAATENTDQQTVEEVDEDAQLTKSLDDEQATNDILANTVEIELSSPGEEGTAPAVSEEDIAPIETGQSDTS